MGRCTGRARGKLKIDITKTPIMNINETKRSLSFLPSPNRPSTIPTIPTTPPSFFVYFLIFFQPFPTLDPSPSRRSSLQWS